MSQVEEVGFTCAACGKQYRWKPELAGKKVKCKCGSPVTVPATAPTAARTASRPAPVSGVPGLAAAARVADVRPRGTSAGAGAAAARPANGAPPPPPPAAGKPPKSADEDDGGMDALLALAQQEAEVAEDATAGADLHFCPNCRSRMNPDGVLCTACGYNRKTGKMLATAKPKKASGGGGGGGLFSKLGGKGAGSPKKADAMAPQGSFMLGLLLSLGFALGASMLWILVAWLTKYELRFLVLGVGAAAGVGMQVGHKGYSRLGGFTAAGITFVVMIAARLCVYLLIIVSAMHSASALASSDASDASDDSDSGPGIFSDRAGQTETKDPKQMLFEQAELAQKRKAKQQAEWDRQAAEEAKKNPPPPPPDPLIIDALTDDILANVLHVDPKFATPEQRQGAYNGAKYRANQMSLADREKMLAPLKAKHDREMEAAELMQLETDRQFKETAAKNSAFHGPVAWQSAQAVAKQNLDKMSPEEKKAELAKLKEWAKADAAEEQKKWDEQLKKEKQAAAKSAAEDGLGDDGSVAAAAGAAAKPATSAPAATAVAVASNAAAPAKTGSSADPDEDDGGDGSSSTNSTANASGSAAAGNSVNHHGSGAAAAVATGIVAVVLLYVLFGGILSTIFLISALFLAYRTAAGASWG